jgi:predicted phosphodiesterase
MPVTFVHLSDIHFGQEKGAELYVHNDVKDRLIDDARTQVKIHSGGTANGVIVSGDIAYAGKAQEYKDAAAWLDRLTAAIGCKKTAVQVVPGNHDIDIEGISSGCTMMLDAIREHGEVKLHTFLESLLDRENLYNRFTAYRPFAEGYDCPLDRSGGIASDRSHELSPGRTLRVIGLNSALICAKKDTEGRLLLGARQHILPIKQGEELIVLCHHPLHWLQDSDEARKYVRNRARVFVSGHEHNPKLRIETIKPGCDLMTLEAGATVPPKAENGYTYTYNILIFDWDQQTDGLKVTIIPRAWSDKDKAFEADDHRLGGRQPTVVLGCPNFRGDSEFEAEPISSGAESATSAPTDAGAGNEGSAAVGGQLSNDFPLLLLRFFRDLTPGQRLTILVRLKMLPDEWSDPLTHAMERRVVDRLATSGRLGELEAALNEIQRQGPNKGEIN